MKLRERIFLNRYTLHISNNKEVSNTFEHFSKFLQVYIPFIFLLTYGANRTLTTFLCNNYTSTPPIKILLSFLQHAIRYRNRLRIKDINLV